MKKILTAVLVMFVTLLTGCHRNNVWKERMSELDSICEQNPRIALNQLDSVKSEVCHAEEWTLRKWQLLYTKAQYKSNIPLTTDSVMRLVVDFFDKTGEEKNRIEANYYLACAYDDMHDSPRCVKYANKALGLSEDAGIPNPQVHLRINSLLAYVHRKQLRAREALEDAQRGYELARKHNLLDPVLIMDLATAYYRLRDTLNCVFYYKTALKEIKRKEEMGKYAASICEMMSFAPDMGENVLAHNCYQLIQQLPDSIRPHNYCNTLASYYCRFGPADSAIVHNQRLLADTSNLYSQQTAARHLMAIYHEREDYQTASQYAQWYAAISDALRAQLQLEQTRNLDNEYQYQRDLEDEKEAYRKGEEMQHMLFVVTLVGSTAIFVLLGISLYQNRRGQEKDKIIKGQRKEKRRLIKRLIQKRMEELSPNIVGQMNKAISGKGEMSSEDWNILYASVNHLYPEYEQQVLDCFPNIDETTYDIAYLMKAGMADSKIPHLMTDISRSSTYRKIKNVRDRMGDLL